MKWKSGSRVRAERGVSVIEHEQGLKGSGWALPDSSGEAGGQVSSLSVYRLNRLPFDAGEGLPKPPPIARGQGDFPCKCYGNYRHRRRRRAILHDRGGFEAVTLFGKAAVIAVGLCKSDPRKTPATAWAHAVAMCSSSPATQKKVCPREAFLGLCTVGYISGIIAGDYTSGDKNKDYATGAVKLLRRTPGLADQPTELWRRLAGPTKVANGQMGVVIALWREGLLAKTDRP
jgi:hypothetical protein